MNHRRRNLLRLAADIHSGLTQHAPSVVVPCWPTDAWQRCQDLLRKIEHAQRRDWLLATDRLRQELAFALALARTGGAVWTTTNEWIITRPCDGSIAADRRGAHGTRSHPGPDQLLHSAR